MIAVTCRNGEHFTIDPAEIERAQSVPDTVLHMVGGRTYVLAMSLDELLRAIRDSHAERLVVQKRLAGGTAELADSASTVRAAATLRVERRARSRDGDAPGSPADRRTDDGPTPDA
ncbi:protein FlbD [Blastococcus aurantiacus]|uniref:Protein FlbD n=1 Tax=Blastococcus aurantiacus TaxID=1550231 RepID=A0A1G7J3C6_9ACTN|nr:flagellar FlbD family protein [Blastococcus aurantiacus]SDF19376.1 protein FlbD [Blastococcus aurantiacus]